MSEEFKSIMDISYDKGTPIWLYTNDYIFGMVPADESGSRWIEVSYTFEEDDPLIKTERDAEMSYQFLMEEVEKGVSFYVEDLKIPLLKEFAKTIETKSGPDKMNALITELTNNWAIYSDQLPIIKNKDELETLKGKV